MNKKILIISILALILSACNSNQIYNEQVEIKNGIWNKDSIIKLKFQINELDPFYNIYISLRAGSMYPAQNLWLFIETVSPSGKIQTDTFEAFLADDKGKWLGDCMGEICDFEIPFKYMIKFPEQGNYNMKIQQGMRRENLPFVMETGIIIEKMENVEKTENEK